MRSLFNMHTHQLSQSQQDAYIPPKNRRSSMMIQEKAEKTDALTVIKSTLELNLQ